MTDIDMRCDICDSPAYVGVASVPGFPVSLAWCKWCLAAQALPLFCVEVTLCDDEEGDFLSIHRTIHKHGLDEVLSIGAEWFMESRVYINANADTVDEPHKIYEGPGYYLKVRDYVIKCAKER